MPPARFPHWFHRIRFRCSACHSALFEMKAGANKVLMDSILEGKFCGACHNGKVAWLASFETCHLCHEAVD
ncbi:MAG: c(7)-type cytochrome triheme domain-containing protein [Nitrospinota bacterium]